MLGRIFFVFLLVFLWGLGASSQGIVVLWPGESIQEAIDRAQTGSLILLRDGVWQENVRVSKDLVIVGEGAVISSKEPNTAVIEVRGKASVSLIGLTLRGAYATEDCPNFRLPCGAGVGVLDDAEVTLIECELTDNERGLEALDHSRVVLIGCSVHGNRAEGAYTRDESSLEALETTFGPHNRHGIFVMDRSRAVIHSCLFTRDQLEIWIWEEGAVFVSNSRFQGEARKGIGIWADFESRFTLFKVTIRGYGVGIVAGDSAVGKLRGVEVGGCQLGVAEHTCYCGFVFAPCAFYGRLEGEITLRGNEADTCPPEGWEGLEIKR